MKAKNFLFFLFFLASISLYSQGDTFIRSSMHLSLIEDFGFDNGVLVRDAYGNYPFPVGVYNNHSIDKKSLRLPDYILSPEEEVKYGVNKTMAGSLIGDTASAMSAGIVQDNSKVEFQLLKYNETEKIAHELIRKWFNIQDDGSFDQNYVNQMINVQLTKEQQLEASSSGSENAEISKNRNYLIDKTFVVYTRMNFVSNEIVAAGIREASREASSKLTGIALDLANKAADKIYEKTSEGFSVWTTGWLFKLKWEEEDYNLLKSCVADRKIDLDKFYSLPFKLDFLGKEKATSLVTFSLKKGEGGRSDKEVIDLSTNRNIDKVLVQLQKGYDQFKPIFPIQSEKPIGAYLGLKEGIEGGETFEVLEKNSDGSYKAIGTIKVDKNNVWDNQYGSNSSEGMTQFKGKLPKGASKGTLIRQKKK
jgi:hypothetical protein